MFNEMFARVQIQIDVDLSNEVSLAGNNLVKNWDHHTATDTSPLAHIINYGAAFLLLLRVDKKMSILPLLCTC